MRINQYSTILDEDRKPVLVKEKSTNFSAVSNIRHDSDIVKILNGIFCADRLLEEYAWMFAVRNDRLIGVFELSHGTFNATFMQPREIFTQLCLCGATAFIIAHNHPSGSIEPSQEDIEITQRLKKAGEMMNITLLDHIIIGDNSYLSFLERKQL